MAQNYVLGQKSAERNYRFYNLIIFLVVLLYVASQLYLAIPLERVSAKAQQLQAKNVTSYSLVEPYRDRSAESYALTDLAKELLPEKHAFILSGGGFSAASNSSQEFRTASLYKLFVAHGILEMVDKDEADLSQGTLEGLTLEQCLDKMITVSDNPCGVYFQAMVNPYSYNQVLNDRGYNCTDISGYFPQSCGEDINKLLEDIASAKYLSQSSSELLVELMSQQTIRDRIPAGFSQASVANKTADLDNIAHDTAIIEKNGQTYFLTILTEHEGWSKTETYQAISSFASKVEALLE